MKPSLYSGIIGRKAEECPDPTPEQQAAQLDQELSLQTQMDWLQHPITAKMFRDLKEEESRLLDLMLDESGKTQPNKLLILQHLNSIRTLRNVKKTYARTYSSPST